MIVSGDRAISCIAHFQSYCQVHQTSTFFKTTCQVLIFIVTLEKNSTFPPILKKINQNNITGIEAYDSEERGPYG